MKPLTASPPCGLLTTVVVIERWHMPTVVVIERWHMPTVVVIERWHMPTVVVIERWHMPTVVVIERWHMPTVVVIERWHMPTVVVIERWHMPTVVVIEKWHMPTGLRTGRGTELDRHLSRCIQLPRQMTRDLDLLERQEVPPLAPARARARAFGLPLVCSNPFVGIFLSKSSLLLAEEGLEGVSHSRACCLDAQV